jgi:hypothetical protein
MTLQNHRMTGLWPNKPDAPNPAITLQLHSGDQWRGVGDLERSADICTRYDNVTIL